MQLAVPRSLARGVLPADGIVPSSQLLVRHNAAASAEEKRRLWLSHFAEVRAETERRAAPLSPEDQVVQSMPDASPIKWHRAHTTWFFEQFLLRPHHKSYRAFDDRFSYLFNSYYVAVGERHARPERGLITRPDAQEVGAYRRHVDTAVAAMLRELPEAELDGVIATLEIGLHHEQQHQELMLTDILHAFATNPCAPIYDRAWPTPGCHLSEAIEIDLPEGIHTVGHQGGSFFFDNEGPAHRALVGPSRIARGLVTNAAWLEFMRDGGYANAALWLSEGWATVCENNWNAPGYWREVDGRWHAMTLRGLEPVRGDAPVCHVSYYEADAFARWAGKALPSETEWEVAANAGKLDEAFGVVWQWTRSAYLPYPGYRAVEGALGEYNGKFMINQMVLRGSSSVTPSGHARSTYRNFFQPPARWQFTGVRLASV